MNISAAAMILKTKGFGKKMTFFIARNQTTQRQMPHHFLNTISDYRNITTFSLSNLWSKHLSCLTKSTYMALFSISRNIQTIGHKYIYIYINKRKSKLRICFFVFSAFIAVLRMQFYVFFSKKKTKNKKTCLI
jgi:hypothetical protein